AGGEGFHPTLRVAGVAEQHGVREPVDDAPADLPQAAGAHESARVLVLAAADNDVDSRLDRVDEALELDGFVREIGVGERDGASGRSEHARTHGRALAA